LVIGNEATGGRPWLGEIYYAAIYDNALSSREVMIKFETVLSKVKSKNSNKMKSTAIPLVRYLFDERLGNKVKDTGLNPDKFNLHIPEKIPVKDTILNLHLIRDLSKNINTIDILLNILAFIPLGFLLHRLLKLKLEFSLYPVFIVLIVGISISLGCEILQHFLPSRSSSIIDVLTNTLGLILGITINKLSATQFISHPDLSG
jgi:VanZ family protein